MDTEAEIAALRAQAEALGETRMAFRPMTKRNRAGQPGGQLGAILRALRQVIGNDPAEQLAVLVCIFPFGLGGPLAHRDGLSMAQASVLIGWLYGLGEDDHLTGDVPVTWGAGTVIASIVGGLRGIEAAIPARQTELAL